MPLEASFFLMTQMSDTTHNSRSMSQAAGLRLVENPTSSSPAPLDIEIALLEEQQEKDKSQLKGLVRPPSDFVGMVSDDVQHDDGPGPLKFSSSSLTSMEDIDDDDEEQNLVKSRSSSYSDSDFDDMSASSSSSEEEEEGATTITPTTTDYDSPSTYLRSSRSAPPSDISWLQAIPNDDNDKDLHKTDAIAGTNNNASPDNEENNTTTKVIDDESHDSSTVNNDDDSSPEQPSPQRNDPPGTKKTFDYQKKGGSSRRKSATPAPLLPCTTLLPSDIREVTHAKWIRLETRRRVEMSLEIQKSQWTTLSEFMKDAIYSLDWAERLILGSAKAGLLFAANLQATSEDKYLDDSGKVVNSNFSQKRLSKSRRNSSTAQLQLADSGILGGESPMDAAILKCQCVLAQQATSFEESARMILEEFHPTLQELKKEIKANTKETKEQGEAIMKELERSEAELFKAWDYFDSLLGLGSMGGNPQTSKNPRLETPKGKGVSDAWLAEDAYIVAVSCHERKMLEASDELDKLCQKVVSMEELRLRKLRSVLLDEFVQQQLKLFQNLPSYDKQMLEDLKSFPFNDKSVEIILQERFMTRWKQSQSHRSSIINRRSSLNNEEEEMPNIESELGTPLESPTVLLAEVVEIQTSGGIGGLVSASWKRTIAVVTKQGNVLLLELPKQQQQQQAEGANAKRQTLSEAFQTLCPSSVEFTESSRSNRRAPDFTRGLTPMASSWTLSKCSVDISQIQNKIVEVTEQGGQQSPRKRLFGGSNAGNHVKHTLRFQSAVDASKWVGKFEKTKGKLGAERCSDDNGEIDDEEVTA